MKTMKKWFEGKKTYSGLFAVLVGVLLVAAEKYLGVDGASNYGLMIIAGGGGFATYGRAVAKAPVVLRQKRKYTRRTKKEAGNVA